MSASVQFNAARRIALLDGAFTGRRVHMIGIGGCGMCGAAAVLLRSGAVVSGSDQRPFGRISELTAAGAQVSIGHDPSQLASQTELVVMSAAVPPDNVELVKARSLGIPVIKYAELLNLIMRQREGVAIAGTHGKSTTTAMTAHLFRAGGLDPSFVVGAHSRQLGGSSGVGTGRHFIVESCEYDRSFLNLHPRMATILNIEKEHLDCYRDLDDIIEAFGRFARNTSADGLVVANYEDPAVRLAVGTASSDMANGRLPARVESFGLVEGADWRARLLARDHGCYSFDVLYSELPLLTARLSVAGRHNVGNALAAIALAFHGGVEPKRMAEALPLFEGVDRRMSVRSQKGGVVIIDDYAHHPTEIRVTLNALRDRFAPKRTWVVFQPHQASRTRYLLSEFAASFGEADIVIVADIYCSRDSEQDRRQVCSGDLVSLMNARGKDARYLPSFAAVTEHLSAHMSEGDLVVTMGAGDVGKVADDLAERVGRAG